MPIRITYNDVLEITHSLYYNYQSACSIVWSFLTPHWIFGEEVIKCLLEPFELLPAHDVDYNKKQYMGLPVEVDYNNPTTLRLVLEVNRIVPKMMDGICYTEGESNEDLALKGIDILKTGRDRLREMCGLETEGEKDE